jgi:hypothetical protein
MVEVISRMGMGFVCWLTFLRTISLALIFVFGMCEGGLECLSLQLKASEPIHRQQKKKNCMEGRRKKADLRNWLRMAWSISDYRMFCVLLNSTVYIFSGNCISAGIFLVVTMGVTSGFATIRHVGVVPMPQYLMFPAFMVILFRGTFVLFPYAVKVNEMFKVIQRYLAEGLGVLVPKDKLKYAKKVVKGTKVGAIAVTNQIHQEK